MLSSSRSVKKSHAPLSGGTVQARMPTGPELFRRNWSAAEKVTPAGLTPSDARNVSASLAASPVVSSLPSLA